jgi:hypothetical protein
VDGQVAAPVEMDGGAIGQLLDQSGPGGGDQMLAAVQPDPAARADGQSGDGGRHDGQDATAGGCFHAWFHRLTQGGVHHGVGHDVGDAADGLQPAGLVGQPVEEIGALLACPAIGGVFQPVGGLLQFFKGGARHDGSSSASASWAMARVMCFFTASGCMFRARAISSRLCPSMRRRMKMSRRRGHGVERGVEALQPLAVAQLLVGQGAGAGEGVVQLARVSGLFAVAVDDQVARDADREEIGAGNVGFMGPAQGAGQAFLKDILGVLGIAHMGAHIAAQPRRDLRQIHDQARGRGGCVGRRRRGDGAHGMPVGNLPGVKLHRPLCPVCFRDVNAGSASLRTTLPQARITARSARQP